MTKATRVERLLADGGFGTGVIAGLGGASATAARATLADMRGRVGYRAAATKLLTSGASQHKLGKNSLPSYALMLTPERGLMSASLADVREVFGLSGAFNLCPMASKGCAAACLSRSGQSGMPAQQRAQAVRTAFLLAHPYEAGIIIGAEIRAAIRRYGRINLRLNTTSDIRWELFAPDMVQALIDAGVIMYDYTAWHPADRADGFGRRSYRLTYSAKEASATPDEYLNDVLRSGRTIAMPFDTVKGQPLPKTWNGWKVIDGDESDERWADPRAVVVGLRAKGYEWKRDNSAGFIRSAN